MDKYVEQASEFSSRARANVYFANPQSIFNGVQFNFVNVGAGNLTFLRRDMVASGRIPLVVARVYDSSSKGTTDFGQGWRLSAAETISLTDGKAHLTTESGSIIDFVSSGDGSFRLEKDYPSDYLALSQPAQDTFRASLRTGVGKEFKLIGEEFRLTRVTDRNGNEVRLIYKNSLLARIENANHWIVLKRNKDGRIILAQDDQGRKVSYAYDEKGRLAEADDLGGHPWQYAYAAEGKLKTAIDPLQRQNFGVVFDGSERVRQLQLPSGTIQYHYDLANRSTTVIDRKKLTSRFFQNEDGITTRAVNALGEETAIDLDAGRNVVSLARNGSAIETMQYDQQHRLVSRHSVADSGPVDRQYSYDPATGLLAGIHASNGQDQVFAYDASGNLANAELADGPHKFSYSPAGDLTGFSTQTAALVFTPDPDGMIATMTDQNKAVTAMQYKAGGELAEATFPNRSQAKYEYQPSGLRSKLVYKDGRRVEYNYDPAGNLAGTKVFDAKGKQVNGQTLEMDDSYQLVRWVLFDGTVTTFQYDANGNLTLIKKGKSRTRFEYDALDRLAAVITPNGQRLTYAYKPGERSLIEQHQHAIVLVEDLRDTGLTFGQSPQVVATRPLVGILGSVSFAETLGTFQLSNAGGSEIILPQELIEAALKKQFLFDSSLSAKALRSGFNIPFNTLFMPGEYIAINCCPECYYDYDEGGWVCPPCNPPPPPIPVGSLSLSSDGSKSPGDNLKFGSNTQTCSEDLGLKDCRLNPGTWVWNVEIEGDVSDDVANWTILQTVSDNTSGFAKDSSGNLQAFSEFDTHPDPPPKQWLQQPAGQTTMFWLDAPGHTITARVNGVTMPIDSMTHVQNFTTTICTIDAGICDSINWFVKIVVSPGAILDRTNSKAGYGTAP